MAKRLRCYLGFHRWQRVKGEGDAGWYQLCRDCGKFGDIPPPPPPVVNSGGTPGGTV
jgi:hypothetical protein